MGAWSKQDHPAAPSILGSCFFSQSLHIYFSRSVFLQMGKLILTTSTHCFPDNKTSTPLSPTLQGQPPLWRAGRGLDDSARGAPKAWPLHSTFATSLLNPLGDSDFIPEKNQLHSALRNLRFIKTSDLESRQPQVLSDAPKVPASSTA